LVKFIGRTTWLLLLIVIVVNPAIALTIYDVQYTTDPSGYSPYSGQTVTISGVVTGAQLYGTYANKLYFIQDGYGPWNGIYCYDRNNVVAIGDSVTVTGVVAEYARSGYSGTITEISPVSSFQKWKSNCTLPLPVILPTDSFATGSLLAESYEGVLVGTSKIRVTNPSLGFGEWQINDGSGPCRVDDFIDSTHHLNYTPTLNDSLLNLIGVLYFDYGDFKIEPRRLGDIIDYVHPIVTYYDPPSKQNYVSTSAKIQASFNKKMNPATMAANFLVYSKKISSYYVADSIAPNSDSTSFTFYPRDSLLLGDTITVTLRTGLTDILGNSLMYQLTWTFYTTPPLVISSAIPADGKINVPTRITPNITFSNPLNDTTVTADKFKIIRQNGTAITPDLYYNSSERMCILEPNTGFALGETITIWVSHGIKDYIGQSLDGNNDGIAPDSSVEDANIQFIIIPSITTIFEVQQPDSSGYDPYLNGQLVTVEGIITSPSSTGSIYIQDVTGGVNIYDRDSTYSFGERLVITATVIEYSGTTEISTKPLIARWGYAHSLPCPKAMLYNQFPTEATEGLLIQFDGTVSSPPSYAGGGYNMNVRNGNSTIATRMTEAAGFTADVVGNYKLGSKVRITGIASQYDSDAPYTSGYQVFLRFPSPYTYHGIQYPADIELLADSVLPSSSARIVAIERNPFSPDLGEVANIEINAPATDHLTLRIYDLKGRLIRTLLNNAMGGHQIVPWDGTDEMHRRANIGIQIVHLRSVAADGKTTDQTKLLVMGTKLK
jgi:hypothetical protein